jgi:hypothetical protein
MKRSLTARRRSAACSRYFAGMPLGVRTLAALRRRHANRRNQDPRTDHASCSPHSLNFHRATAVGGKWLAPSRRSPPHHAAGRSSHKPRRDAVGPGRQSPCRPLIAVLMTGPPSVRSPRTGVAHPASVSPSTDTAHHSRCQDLLMCNCIRCTRLPATPICNSQGPCFKKWV